MSTEESSKFENWFKEGYEAGWITEPTCWNHDIIETTEDEETEIEEGGDPCIPIVRLWYV